ncbi:MAG: 30S ribosomal protein S7 [Chloroflexi bacterium]|nr:30S ribosomal protein S7 [Chloroflexota bacterium]
MSRRRRAEVRVVIPDPKYGSADLSRFINYVMLHGKKTTAQRAVYGALEVLEEQARRPGVEVFGQALRNVMPMLEVKSRRVGGATYQVPTEVRPSRRQALAMRWIIGAARARTGKPLTDRLATELLDASRGQGTAVRRKEDLHRMAEANRAFAHYKW